MGVKVKTKRTRIPKMEQVLDTLNGMKVKAGVMGELAWLARIHEYGCKIKITPKMRKFLRHKGLHIKNSTEYIVIPERAFLRNGYKECKDGVLDVVRLIMCDVISGNISVEEYVEQIGEGLVSGIAGYATDLNSPPNHPFTVQQKGSDNPLMDTGDMIQAIDYKVER